MLWRNFRLAQLESFLTAIVIDSRNFLLMECQNQGIYVAVFWEGSHVNRAVLTVLHWKGHCLWFSGEIAFRTKDWRSIEECCACRPRFTLLFFQMLYFNPICFLLCIWKRLFHILSENYTTVKCPVCLYVFPYWLHVLIFLFNYCPSVFVDILQC